ncbi:diguanylate cyclase domain protein [Paraburkholderia xenovorans LB400]|uniref:diguanylate cyclase n=1 Tax=Paraburkholderia xenovorans (strain LB400) TaxID=266265 RepID=Q13G56_PARXL|nr:GGDEF domain-containing protein [Paraburkholderia xenovorans]ABE36933.1 Putative diguanylate cyclase (GGDEF domain) [Paraburkholderia xenovorans LB400]AIP34614.1 diguanylate cyclase domain protein [Paraburkholderia xenovorans LB400]
MRRFSQLLASTLAFTVFACFGIVLTRATWGVSSIWPANGLIAGLALDGTQTRERDIAIAVAAGGLAANLWLLPDRSAGLIFSLGNVVEVSAMSMSLRFFRAPLLAVPNPQGLYRFLTRAVLLPTLISALVVGVATHIALGWPALIVAASWLFSDALGIAIFLPLGYVCRRASRVLRRALARERLKTRLMRNCRNGFCAHAIVALVSVGSFHHAHWVPLYWVLPSLVLAVLWAGSYAAVTGTFITAAVAVVSTVREPFHSPFGTFARPADAIFDVQGFALACLLTSYLMAAVLADGRRYLAQVSASHHKQTELAERLWAANKELKALALQDALTGLANRRHFVASLDHAMRTAWVDRTAVAVIFIDVDWFKRFNDRYGHERGDAALCAVATALTDALTNELTDAFATDLAQRATVARIGGEEFAIVLPDADEASATQLAGSALARIRALSIAHEGSPHRNVTISVGVALSRGKAEAGASALLARADAAMYRAKREGRDRCVVLAD